MATSTSLNLLALLKSAIARSGMDAGARVVTGLSSSAKALYVAASANATPHGAVLYVVPDNGFAISVPTADQQPAPVSDWVRGFRGLDVHRLDGTDYFCIRRAAKAIVDRVRAGVGPALLHCDVVRPYSHSAADTQTKYRPAEELR